MKRIINYLKKSLIKNNNLVIADSLPDNLSRQLLLETFKSNIIFIHVFISKATHLSRLRARKGHFFKTELLEPWIKKHWEKIAIPYISFSNEEKEENLDKRLLTIYQKSSNKQF